MIAPCSQAASLVESVRSWIINRVNITLKPTSSLHWAENHQWPAPRAPISPLILVGLLAWSSFLSQDLILSPKPALDLTATALPQFLQCKDSGMSHHGLLLKNTNSPSKYVKTAIKNDPGFRNLCFSNHKGTECGPWKSYVALQVKAEKVRVPLQTALRQLLLVISHVHSCP